MAVLADTVKRGGMGEEARYRERAGLRWNLISLMGETFPTSEVISLELSHRVSDFWLIARRRCQRRRHPWIRRVGRDASLLFSSLLSFFLSSFSRRTKVNGWNEELVKGERHRWAWSVSVFFNHPEKELERVASYVWIGQMLEWKGWARTCSRLSVARVSQLFVQRSRVLDVLHEACEHGFSRSFGVVGGWFATIDMGKGQ